MEGAKLVISKAFSPRLVPALVFRYLVGGLLIGFILGTKIIVPSWAAGLATVLTLLVVIFLKTKNFGVFLLLGLSLALGRWSLMPWPPLVSEFVGPQIFTAEVVTAPRISSNNLKYLVKTMSEPARLVSLQARSYPAYTLGDRLWIDCLSVKPTTLVSLQHKNIWRQCAWPQLTYLSTNDRSIKTWLNRLSLTAGNSLRQLLPEPYATLASGMLWGDDNGLPNSLVKNFRATSTSHLLAVSGYNVTTLIQIIFTVLLGLGLWRKSATIMALGLISLFVIFTGAEPAVVRAGIMGAILLLVKIISRRADNINLLLGTASAMLIVAPNLLFDLGFQLSFASMVGLSLLAPLLQSKFKYLPEELGLRESFCQTLSATLATLPIIVWQIGQISLVSPLANLLIAPIVLVVFILGLPLVLLAWLLGVYLTPIAWLLTLALSYVIWVVETLANLPGAITKVSLLIWPILLVGYAWLTRFVYKNYQLIKI